MTSYNDLILDDDYKLRITSKRLQSGRYQVKFYATIPDTKKELYGYLLVSADETLKHVIQKIRTRLKTLDLSSGLVLSNMAFETHLEPHFMIFQ